METGGDADLTGGKVYAKPFIIRKRIGATSHEISAYFRQFGQSSRETFDEKILRLVRSEALNGGADR
jgi:hypothetical protein